MKQLDGVCWLRHKFSVWCILFMGQSTFLFMWMMKMYHVYLNQINTQGMQALLWLGTWLTREYDREGWIYPLCILELHFWKRLNTPHSCTHNISNTMRAIWCKCHSWQLLYEPLWRMWNCLHRLDSFNLSLVGESQRIVFEVRRQWVKWLKRRYGAAEAHWNNTFFNPIIMQAYVMQDVMKNK